ncbi:hypothetical protein [Enhygromyxa salina]|uniref:hypothetical protein n=1 Tax=Enhygromyxa salina TaxID=215803 RepID=UPI000D03FABC|nr:hypothetical protein [Enhygromyxa salina]
MPTNDCPTPDAAKCVSEGYLESSCGRRHQSTCEPHVVAALKAHYNATAAPKLPMLGPNHHDLPGDLKQGKYFAYTPAKTLVKAQASLSKVYRKVADPIAGHVGMSTAALAPVDRLGKVSPSTAAAYHREPSWAANGNKVESCAEYAYERSHDVVRFIDAASACRGDRECVFDVAYLDSTPGIADRNLVDTSGRALPKLPLAKGTFVKNDLFALGDRLVRANGVTPLPPTPSILALEAALRDGLTWYQLGSCKGKTCNTRKFSDEWAWHEHLHQATNKLSQAEFEEYEARRAAFRALLEDWAAAVDGEHQVLMQAEVADVVLPFDMRANNPFERFELEHDLIERSNQHLQQVKKRFGTQILDMRLEDAVKQVVGAQSQAGSLAFGVFAAPAMGPSSSNTPTPAGGAKQPSANNNNTIAGACVRASGWGLEMNGAGKLSCRIGEFLRDEWARKQAGEKSCLDLGNPDCDWALPMFEAAILDGIPLLDRQLRDERTCMAWQDGATFPAASVAIVENRLEANEAAFAETWPLVKPFDQGTNSSGRKFGKDWGGGDYIGDKDWFAAGYHYDLGWNVTPLAKNGQGSICKVGGSIHANTGFDAWIVGAKVEVVDGAVRAESNIGTGGQVRYNAHLEMFDQSLFSTANEPDDWKVAQSFSTKPSAGFGISLPVPAPRFDIYVGVPISGQLWGELLFGSALTMSGEAGASCEGGPKFGIRATYMPLFAAYGLGQVGVGVAGVVSAGVRASLTLVMVGVPLEVGMQVKTKQGKQVLSFDSQVSLLLSTLAGRVSLYIEFLMFDEEWELFRWDGFGPLKADLMPRLGVEVPLSGMK